MKLFKVTDAFCSKRPPKKPNKELSKQEKGFSPAKDKRMAMERKCSLKKCIQGNLENHMAHVEVKTFELPAEDRDHMEVAWQDDGQAAFHDICWKAIVDSYKMDNPFILSPREKEMIMEARKSSEYYDSFEKLKLEAERIARMLKSAQYGIAFTGAGISTAAGIGDFRGRHGKWTEKDREKLYGPAKHKRSREFCYEKLQPTYTHEAILKLLDLGYIKHIISQNTDGLHRLSGVPRDKISELHGNSFHEKCEKCGARSERPFAVRRCIGRSDVPPRICVHCHFDHRTGRLCERKGCDGYLMNTIINFGDSLEKRVLSNAEEHAKRSDFVLCIGSTLRVTPACDLVEAGQPPVRIAICNRQPTPFDRLCYQFDKETKSQLGSRVYGNCDDLLREIMKLLLTEDDLQEWEEGRESRIEEYASQRELPKC